MNPPFANGDEHVLHAWEILKKGSIIALLNAETITNPFSTKRHLLGRIIKENGTIEMLGNCFHNADRRTNVEIALVRLHKNDEGDMFRIDLGDTVSIEDVPDFSEVIKRGGQIAINNQMEAFLRAWEKAKESMGEYIRARDRMQTYVETFLPAKEVVNTVEKSFEKYCVMDNRMGAAYNAFLDRAKSEAWRKIVSKMGVDKYMTNNLRRTFNEFCQSQNAYELNEENVRKIVNFVCLNIDTIMKKAVVDVYDMFTKFYPENAVHVEGWKTNKRFMVNRKVILPDFVDISWRTYSISYYRSAYYEDIDRVMCWLSGVSYDLLDTKEYHSIRASVEKVSVGDSSLHESAFFQFRCYKKGTIHLYFKDEKLWERFNQVVNDGKNQLGYNL